MSGITPGQLLRSLIFSVTSALPTKAAVQRKINRFGFGKKQQVEYLQDFLTWLEDGCNPMQAAKGIAAGYKKDSDPKGTVQYRVSQSLSAALANGGSIYEGMTEWFDDDILAIFESGENAGPAALKLMMTEFIKQQTMINEVKSALLKPVLQPFVYLIIGFMLLSGYHLYVLPNFLDIMPLEKWDSIVQTSNHLVNAFWGNFWLGSIVLIAAVSYYFWFLKNGVGDNRQILDQYYPLSLNRNLVSMRLMKTLGILVLIGDNPRRAISRMLPSASAYERHFLKSMYDKLIAGEQKVDRFMDVGLLEKSVFQRLASIAAINNDDTKKAAISMAADRSAIEIRKSMKKVTRVIVTVVWLLVGTVMFMGLISFLGIMDIQSAIAR